MTFYNKNKQLNFFSPNAEICSILIALYNDLDS